MIDHYEPLYQNSYLCTLTDNGARHNYHKMYFAFAGGAEDRIKKGTVWKAATHYKIEFI